MLAGDHRVTWDAYDQSSGIYFYSIKAGDKVETRKMVLMKQDNRPSFDSGLPPYMKTCIL